MSNNYTQATVTPDLPASAFTPEDLALLEKAGFSWEGDDELYFFVAHGINDTDDDHLTELDWEAVFQRALVTAGIPEVIVEGAYWCDKLRQGEFGGFVYRITEHQRQVGNTYTLLETFRKEKL